MTVAEVEPEVGFGKPEVRVISGLDKIYKIAKEEIPTLMPLYKDRKLSETRVQILMKQYENGRLRDFNWVSAICADDGKHYRVNGQTSSEVVRRLVESGKSLPDGITVIRVTYHVPTIRRAIDLHSTYDAKYSARSDREIIAMYASDIPQLENFSDRYKWFSASALAFSKHFEASSAVTADERALLMYENIPLCVFLCDVQDKNRVNHMRRMPVLAALVRMWEKNRRVAQEFADQLNTGSTQSNMIRQLRDWLMSHSVRSGTHSNAIRKAADPREIYARTIKGWNFWRAGHEDTKLIYRRKDPLPEPD